RRRHTRFSRDWSSDVCASDLSAWMSALVDRSSCGGDQLVGLVVDVRELTQSGDVLACVVSTEEELTTAVQGRPDVGLGTAAVAEIGRASCRERERPARAARK